MAFSGGGSNVTLPHTHDSDVVQDGGSLAANATQFGLSAGSILYSDGSNIQELAVGSAADALVVNGAGTAPSWASAGGVTLTRAQATTASFQSTTSTGFVDVTSLTHTAQAGTGNCICAYNGECEHTAGMYLRWSFGTDGDMPEYLVYSVTNQLIQANLTNITSTLSSQVCKLQFRAESGTAKLQSDSLYNGTCDFLEIS